MKTQPIHDNNIIPYRVSLSGSVFLKILPFYNRGRVNKKINRYSRGADFGFRLVRNKQ